MKIRMEDFPDAVARYLSYKLIIQNASEKTVYEYSIDLKNFLQYVYADRADDNHNVDLSRISDDEIGKISTQKIYEYLLYTASDLGNRSASRARKLCVIKGFFKFLSGKEKLISSNPAKDIDAPRIKKALPKHLTLEESILLLETAKNSKGENNKRDFAILTLFLNCGMRVSELAGISLQDLSADFTQLVVTGKGNKQRVIYLNESCQEALKAYWEERRGLFCKDEKALFVSRNHLRLSVKSVQWLVYKYLKEAGLGDRNYSVHKLRHTAATLMYSTGQVDVRVLKDILGHEQLNTTQIYTHLSDDQMKKAMAKNPLNQKTNSEE